MKDYLEKKIAYYKQFNPIKLAQIEQNLQKKEAADFAGRPLPDTPQFTSSTPAPYSDKHVNHAGGEVLKKKMLDKKEQEENSKEKVK